VSSLSILAHAPLSGLDRYGFLASAIAGRAVTIQWASMYGDRSYSDGQSIFLQSRDRVAGRDDWAAIVAQAALIGAGSLHASIVRRLVGRPVMAQRYLYLEMLRAAGALADRLPWAFTERLKFGPPKTESPLGSVELAATRIALPAPPAYFGSIWPLLVLRTGVSQPALAALPRNQQHGRSHIVNVPELDYDDEGETSKLLRLFRNPFSVGNPLSDLFNRILNAGVSKQHRDVEAGDGGAEMPIGRVERALKQGINAILSKLPGQLPDINPGNVSPALTYPEWDVYACVYRRHWVFVEEAEAWRDDAPHQPFGFLLNKGSPELRRQLSRLGLDQEMHRHQNDGSDFNLDALIACSIELRAGRSPPSLQVYRSIRRTRRDLAITLIVDISGSTGERQGGDLIFNKQLNLAYGLGQVLESLGDTVAMFGFHSWGRKLVRVVRIKGHNERWSLRVAERMAQLEPVGYTRIGAAVRHGTHVLNDTIRMPNRLLVLITDGIAYDQDYELSYAAGDASRALDEARDAGTACVCLSVSSGTDTEKLKKVFGAANILAVDEVAQVTGRIREVCRHALASVTKRRFGNEMRSGDPQ
jgi:nitric oxide reductase NorD protein